MILTTVLHELVTGQKTSHELSGGLRFQVKIADNAGQDNRLLCYRIGDVGPSDRELGIVRRHLEQLRPGVEFHLAGRFEYTGRDGQVRHCRVFSWAALAQVGMKLEV